MKLEIELTDKQYILLSKRSEMIGISAENLTKSLLAVFTDTTDEEFVAHLEELAELTEDEFDDDYDDEEDYDDEDDYDDEEDYEEEKKRR